MHPIVPVRAGPAFIAMRRIDVQSCNGWARGLTSYCTICENFNL